MALAWILAMLRIRDQIVHNLGRAQHPRQTGAGCVPAPTK